MSILENYKNMCHGQDGKPPTFNDGILIMGPYKPLLNWVDEFVPYYMEIMGVYTLAHMFSISAIFDDTLW